MSTKIYLFMSLFVGLLAPIIMSSNWKTIAA